MNYRTVILLIFCSVSLAKNTDNKKNQDGEDDRWTWGFVEEPDTINNRNQELKQTSTTSSPLGYDPCAGYNPPKPSFKAPGRRVNEEKCKEYIWDIETIEESIKRNEECIDRNPYGIGPFTVGGRNAIRGEFPHMGALGWKAVTGGYIFKCGSTLISSKFIMTAAHCIRAPVDTTIEDPEPKIVRLNDQNIFIETPENGIYFSSDVNISKIIVHPQYKSPKKYFDIALMELSNTIEFTSRMRPACLWNKPDYGSFGEEVSLTGWGVLKQGSQNISPDLQAANVEIIDQEKCDKLLFTARNRHWHGLEDTQLCAGKLVGGVDACQGDSGGPLQFRQPVHNSSHGNIYYVIGITSFGVGCAQANTPGIYTRVSSFVEWIESHVWK